MGTLTRLRDQPVDLVLVVVEPTAKSIEAGRRIVGMVRERQLGRIVVVANRIRDDSDLERIVAVLSDNEIVTVPDDPAVRAADREGAGLLDHAPHAPAVAALVGLAQRLAAP